MLYFCTVASEQHKSVYTLAMDTNELRLIAEDCATIAWAKFSRLYTLKKPCPTIIINNRLKTTAGRCDFAKRVIDLSPLLFNENISEFKSVIIPHEIAHQIAWDIHGDSGHGEYWKSVMVKYGLPPARCHHLVSAVIESNRTANTQRKIRKMAESFTVGDTCAWDHTDRQKNITIISGVVIRVNVKTITMVDRVTRKEWRVPFENHCNLRHA